MHSNLLCSFVLIAAAIPFVRTHGVITAVQGDNGQTGAAFGMVASTPRDGTNRNPFQTDSSIIRDREVASGKASACGRTLAGGVNDISSSMAQAESDGLPSVGPDGRVKMSLHQVNGDGGGPYSCAFDASGAGTNFTPMNIETNIPGKNSRSRAKAVDLPLVAVLPPGTSCTGGSDGQTCLVRCRNDANAGPFGGCVAVTQSRTVTKRQLDTKASGTAPTPSKAPQGLTADQRLDQMIRQAELAEAASDGDESDILTKRSTVDQRLDEMIRQAEMAEAAEDVPLVKTSLSEQRLDKMIAQAEYAEAAENGDA